MLRTLLPGLLTVAALATGLACTSAPAPAGTGAAPTAPPAAAATTAPAAAATAAATAAPITPKRLTVALTGIPGDISTYNTELTNTYLKPAIYEQMVLMETPGAQPWLATSWRVVNPTTWEFTMRPSRFWNGDPVTSEDVKFAIERPLDPAEGLALARSTVASVERVETPDALVCRIITTAPDPLIPNRVARVEVFQKKYFDQVGKDEFALKPMGSGPYMIRSYTPRQTLEVVPNPLWWGDKPRVSEIVFRDVTDPAVRLAALRTGEVDLIQSVSAAQVDGMVADGAKSVRATIPVVTNLSIDTTDPAFADRRVRLAMSHGVNVPNIINTLLQGKTEQAPGQAVSDRTFGYNPAVQAYPYDLERARRLMAEAGVPNGFTTRFGYGSYQPGYGDFAQAIAADLARIGIRTELFGYDAAYFQANFRSNGVAPLYISGFNSAILFDPAGAVAFLSSNPATSNGRYNSPEFDRLFEAQATELDQGRRREILQQIMKVLHDDPPSVYLWVFTDFWGMKPAVEDFRVQDNGIPDWLSVWVR